MRTALPILAVLALGFACNTVVDEDLDGFAEEYDCDDSSAAVHPGAAELCDGIDNDCDDAIDEEATDGLVFFPDGDSDGFGSFGENVVACEAPTGYVDNADDCNDAAPAVFPGADEVCDDVDNDCNGAVDDDTTDGTTYYADWDGDGFGSTSVFVTACEQPAGYVTDDTDCNDFDVLANPDHREICDHVDNDCDGTIDEPEEAYGVAQWWMDADTDGYGAGEVHVSCFAPDGYTDNPDDCDDTLAEVNPGMVEVCNDGLDNDCTGDAPECIIEGVLGTNTADYLLVGENSSDYLGGYGAMDTADIDGDGNADLLLGAYGHDTPSTSSGAAYVFYGPLSDVELGAEDADTKISPPRSSYGQYMGRSTRGAGDVNGDGYDDVITGGYYTYGGYSSGSYTGAGYLLYGSSTGLDATEDASDHATFWGESSSQYFGGTVAPLGDLDGDGYDEIAFGAYGNDDGDTNGGSIYVFMGSSTEYSGDYDAEDADFIIQGDYYQYLGYYYGHSVSGGDFDGDGYSDMLIGSPNYSSSDFVSGYGTGYIYYGGSGMSGEYYAPDTADAILVGASYADYFGRTTHAADLTGDGYDELIVGEYANGNGMVWVFDGSATQLSGMYYADDDESASYEGANSSDNFGYALVTGDWNNDGEVDLGVGAPYADPGGNSSSGTFYVFYGGLSSGEYDASEDASANINGVSSSNYVAHYDSAASGDMDADGIDDVIVGSYQSSSYAGEVYLFMGGGM